jgi:hypothetical protein
VISETVELDLEKVGDGIENFGPTLSEECKPAICMWVKYRERYSIHVSEEVLLSVLEITSYIQRK